MNKTKKSIENLKAATEALREHRRADTRTDTRETRETRETTTDTTRDTRATTRDSLVLDDGDTQEYIKNLLKGSGASINFDVLRDELSADADAGNPSISNLHSFNTNSNSNSISISNSNSNSILKTTDQKDPNISQIPQKAFFSSSQISARSSTAKNNLFFKEKDNAASSVGSRNPLGSSNGQILNLQDLEKSPVTKHEALIPAMTMTNNPATISNSKYESSTTQLEKLSKRLIGAHFNPLHSSLLACSETQAFYLNATLEGLINEFEYRGTTIQNLINQLARPVDGVGKENITPLSCASSGGGGDHGKSLDRIQDLERQIHELKQDLDQKTYLSEKLQFEAKAQAMRNQSSRNRNFSMMEAIKQKYYYDNPGLEPIISTIIETYEEKLASSRSAGKPYESFLPNESIPYPSTKNLEAELFGGKEELEAELCAVKEELKATQQERDLLNLKLINEARTWSLENRQDESLAHDVSTRERIQRDKKVWREKHGHHHKSILNTSTIDATDSKAMIKEICRRLGITDFDNILPAVEKIQLVVRLIPQMEQFIRDVNATITAYNIKDTSMTSSISPSPQKLTESLAIIRRWADNMASSSEHQKFITDLHSTLKIGYSAGSLEKCTLEIGRVMEQAGIFAKPGDLDETQEIVMHLMGLFNIPAANQVLARMNELYVFWAEVTNGLKRLREALRIESSVQPGRVLVHAAEILEMARV